MPPRKMTLTKDKQKRGPEKEGEVGGDKRARQKKPFQIPHFVGGSPPVVGTSKSLAALVESGPESLQHSGPEGTEAGQAGKAWWWGEGGRGF